MIVVTGATGLVGGHLLWHLLQENEKVVALKRISSNMQLLERIFGFYGHDALQLLTRIEWRDADVLNEKSLDVALRDIDMVYHCAAVVSLGMGSAQLINTNVQGTRNVVEAAMRNNVDAFCMVSSIAACGKSPNHELIDENTFRDPDTHFSAYAQSKFQSENVVWDAIAKGLNACIVNPGVILGFSGTQTGSAQLFAQVRKGLPFYTLGGSGYVDVQDVVKAMMLLMKNKKFGQRYIVVAENNSNKEILTWIARGFNKMPPFVLVGSGLLLGIGAFAEKISKWLNTTAPIDKSLARAATHRAYYSANKLTKEFDFKFNSIEKCIDDVCKHWMRVF